MFINFTLCTTSFPIDFNGYDSRWKYLWDKDQCADLVVESQCILKSVWNDMFRTSQSVWNNPSSEDVGKETPRLATLLLYLAYLPVFTDRQNTLQQKNISQKTFDNQGQMLCQVSPGITNQFFVGLIAWNIWRKKKAGVFTVCTLTSKACSFSLLRHYLQIGSQNPPNSVHWVSSH